MQDSVNEGIVDSALIDVLRRYWLVIGGSVVGFALVGVLFSLVSPQYSATASILIEDPRSATVFDQSATTSSEAFIADQITILQSEIVASRAADQLREEFGSELDVDDVGEAASAAMGNAFNVVDVTFRSGDPEVARGGADALVAAYQEVRRDQVRLPFERAIDEFDEELDEIDAALGSIEETIDEASVPLQINDRLLTAYDRLDVLESESEDASGEEAAAIQTAIANQLLKIQVLQSAQSGGSGSTTVATLLQERELLLERRASLSSERDELALDAELISGGATVLSSASAGPALGGMIGTATVAGLLGLIFGAGVASLLSLREARFTSPSDPERMVGAPLLAVIPHLKESGPNSDLPALAPASSASGEAFRFVATAVAAPTAGEPSSSGTRGKVQAFVSPGSEDGRSYVVANVGIAAAVGGKNVLLIDADFETQGLSNLLKSVVETESSDLIGLESRENGGAAVFDIVVRGGGRLALASGGGGSWTKSALALLKADAAATFLDDVRSDYDLILVDGPPATRSAYAATLASYADKVVAVVRSGTPVPMLNDLLRRFALLDIAMTGYVYNEYHGKPQAWPRLRWPSTWWPRRSE